MSPAQTQFEEVLTVLEQALAHKKAVAVLGCGSPLRGDDAVGSVIAEQLAQQLPEHEGRARVFQGEAAPENQTGAIKHYDPDLILVIDAMDLGLQAGEVRIIPLDEVASFSFSTHMLPLPIVLDYLKREIGCEIVLLGIQASSLEFLAELSKQVAQTASRLTEELTKLLS